MDEKLMEWEAYVSAGQPRGPAVVRFYFVSLDDRFERPRWVAYEKGDVAEAHRVLGHLKVLNVRTL